MAQNEQPATERVRVRRLHEHAHYNRAALDAVLDTAKMAHIGYTHEGRPYVTPTFFWRQDDYIYWHGSTASAAINKSSGAEVCVNISLLDGLILAKSAYSHAARYRSATLYGKAEIVSGEDNMIAALKTYMDLWFPGRWETLRPVGSKELKATAILRLAIEEYAVKITDGGPQDFPEDQDYPVWSGVIPLNHAYGAPIADPNNNADLVVPENIAVLAGKKL